MACLGSRGRPGRCRTSTPGSKIRRGARGCLPPCVVWRRNRTFSARALTSCWSAARERTSRVTLLPPAQHWYNLPDNERGEDHEGAQDLDGHEPVSRKPVAE